MSLDGKKIDERTLTVFVFALLALVLVCGQSFGMGLTPPPSSSPAPLLNATYSSSIPVQKGSPSRIAMDNSGVLYVAAPNAGQIIKFASDGKPAGFINGFVRPGSVAVDSVNRVYVGDFYNGSVVVSGKNGFTLGKGPGEFGLPGSIAIASNWSIYVTDSFQSLVKVYSSTGAFKFSFGGYGTNPGQMIYPTGIAADNTNREIYVVDHNNARIEVFDFNGVFKRTFSSYGQGAGLLTRPQGISVVNGNVYVADAYQSNIEVFDRNGGFITFIGQYGDGQGEMKVPLDVMQRGSKLFVSNSENGRIEVFSVIGPNGLVITPLALSFTAAVNTTPPSQTLQVAPAVAGANVSWTASVTAPFIRLDQVSGTTGSGPSTVTVSISTTGLAAGTYTGQIIFTANGTAYPATVTLSVVQSSLPRLFVSPSSLNLSYQKNGQVPTANLSITSSGGTLQWQATPNVSWLSLSQTSGSTPGTVTVSLTPAANNLPTGSYKGVAVFTGSNSQRIWVSVYLQVSASGTILVTSNLDAASFTITGPTTSSGAGKQWRTDDAEPGSHTIAFKLIKGFRKPAQRTFEVKTGKAVAIDASYEPLRLANMIVAAKGPDPNNDALVRVFDLEGTLLNEFATLDTFYGAKVTTADIDGDGNDEIIVTPGSGAKNEAFLKIFRSDGSPLASTAPVAGTGYGANAAVGSIAGDGSTQIAVSMVDQGTKVQTITVYTVEAGYALTEKTSITLTPGATERGSGIAAIPYPAALAFGDIHGDGRLELIIAVASKIMVYGFDEGLSAANMLVEADLTLGANSPITLSPGDLNGDGIDEIMVGYSDGKDALVRVLKGDLSDYGLSLKAFEGDTVAAGISSMDKDGDGIPEVLAGRGPLAVNDAVIRIYGSGGALLGEIKAFETARYGVNAVFGVINASGSAKR